MIRSIQTAAKTGNSSAGSNPQRLHAAIAEGKTTSNCPVRTSNQIRIGIAFLAALSVWIPCPWAGAQSVTATLPLAGPGAVAVNETTNMIYVAAAGSANQIAANNTVTVINGASSTVAATIQAGGPFLGALAVNSKTNTIYAVNNGTLINELSGNTVIPGSVAVINGATNAVTTTIALPLYGGAIAINQASNQVYVIEDTGAGNGEQFSLAIIDGATNTITDTISLGTNGMGSFTVDTAKNLAYGIGGNYPGNGVVTVVDLAARSVKTTIPVGYNDNEFVYNQATGTLYVPDAHGTQMYVIDGSTNTATTVPLQGTLELFGLAINPVANKIYLTAQVNNAFSVEVFDAATKTITDTIADPAFGPLLVNSATNKIWQASSPVVILNGATGTTATVTGTSGVTIENGALNTTTNYGYITEQNDVLVINGAPAGPAFTPSADPLAFGNQTIDTTSNAMTLTVTNSGTTSLSISAVAAGGTNSADFPVASDTCAGESVAAGSTCTVSVKFMPSIVGSETASLSFTDNATGSPHVVDLTGAGTAPVATASKTSLSASATSISVGTSVTFTATVTPASGTPTPTGTVTFKNGSTTLSTGTLNGSGVATYATASLALGTDSITANYGGDSRNLASASSATVITVAHDSTTTTLTSSVASLVVGASVTFTASVAGPSGAAAPTGTVTFSDGTKSIGTGSLNTSGMATLSTSALAAGSHNVSAAYAGDTNNAASTSAAVAVVVWPGPPDFTLALSPATGTFKAGSPVTVSVTIASVNGFSAATNLSCGTLPKNSKCVFSESSITPGSSGTATSTLTIDTDVKATSTALDSHAKSGRQLELAGTAGLLLLLPLVMGKSRRVRRLLLAVCGFACIGLLTTAGISGCGGGPTTPKGNYSVQVTAAAGSTTHSATFSLTVD